MARKQGFAKLMNDNRDGRSPAVIRVGTRGSRLARLQSDRVTTALESAHDGLSCETVVISTSGDMDKQTPLSVLGGQAVFAKELQQAILDADIDCAVHSAKDLTSILPDGLTLAAVLDRSDPRDVLVSRYPGGLADLPPGARVGTSSRRRMAQLRLVRPDVEIVELRGNVDTRLAKVFDDTSQCYDAAILAAAGVLRMGHEHRISEYLDLSAFTPAPGQAALAVDCRAADRWTREILEAVRDPTATLEVEAERAFLRTIGGGCTSPLAAHARVEGDIIRMWAMLADVTMERVATSEDEADMDDGVALAVRIATALMDRIEA